MKKTLSVLLMLISFAFLFHCFAWADALPTVNEALQSMTADSGRIEVSDDLSAFDPDNFGDFDFGELKFVILERQAPEKEFTEYDSGYPLHYVEGFPDDFQGVDVGTSRVWLRCDLMNRIPYYYRATSMESADIILIAETQYSFHGSFSVTTYSKSDDEEIPQFDSIEEMEAYISSHQPVIDKITYYPKFGVYNLLDLYSPVTKECQIYDYTYSAPRRFASNPEAQDLWDCMETLSALVQILDGGALTAEEFDAVSPDLEEYIAQEKLAFWRSCLDSGEYASAAASMQEYYWSMADDLRNLDPDGNHRANYDLILEARDAEALYRFANFCNYSGFDTPVEEIRDAKEYLAAPDFEWIETALNELVEMLSE